MGGCAQSKVFFSYQQRATPALWGFIMPGTRLPANIPYETSTTVKSLVKEVRAIENPVPRQPNIIVVLALVLSTMTPARGPVHRNKPTETVSWPTNRQRSVACTQSTTLCLEEPCALRSTEWHDCTVGAADRRRTRGPSISIGSPSVQMRTCCYKSLLSTPPCPI